MADQENVVVENARGCEETRCGQCYRPNVDILEKPDELVVVADVPGAVTEKISVDFADGILSVHAPVDASRADGRTYLAQEFGVGDYYRSFRVSQEIDPSRIAAECADGVLTLHLPKAETVKPRKIAVQAR
ncbi:MAG TPA: Hsp20/alpha crystallin family protein [Thermoguttaceae bacterium]|nr:Hsp20/alpha crystallin family protein [Thermoguttaceae bacterium]